MTGDFVNPGVLFGPWLPIYGTGSVLALIALKRIRENHLLTFFAMVLLAGIIEYFTSWFLETTFGLKWWDYTGYFLNLNGRICLEGLLTFGLAGSLAIYFIAPLLDELLQKIPQQKKNILLSFLLAFFFADLIHSLFQPNTGLGITDYPASPAMKP